MERSIGKLRQRSDLTSCVPSQAGAKGLAVFRLWHFLCLLLISEAYLVCRKLDFWLRCSCWDWIETVSTAEEKETVKWDAVQPANGFGEPDCCVAKEASGIYFTYWRKGESCGLGTCFEGLQCTIIAFGLCPSAAQNPDGSGAALNQDGCHFTSHCECTTWSTGLWVAFLFRQRILLREALSWLGRREESLFLCPNLRVILCITNYDLPKPLPRELRVQEI